MSKIERRSAATPSATLTLVSLFEIDSPHMHTCFAQLIYLSIDEDHQSCTFIPEDIILAEILPRLHIKSLYRFKCVSKRYRSIISHPVFARNYLQRAYTTSSPESLSSLGLFATLLYPLTDSSPNQDDRSQNIKALTDTIHSGNGPYRDDQDQLSISLSSVSLPYNNSHRLVASSNGLLLSHFFPDPDCYMNQYTVTLCVSNPLTKQCVKLPDPGQTLFSSVWVFGIATRLVQTAAAFLTYKVLAIKRNFGDYNSDGHPNFTVQIFSSDTGSWSTWEASCPGNTFTLPTKGCFVYKGIMHFLDRPSGTVITYDPYDSPDRFDRIRLPSAKFVHSSLIYSGDEEMLKFCEIVADTGEPGGVDKLSVWQLVGDSEWCYEGEFRVPSLPHKCKNFMVALNPWNRLLICHPYVMQTKFTVINARTGTWKLVDVFKDSTLKFDFSYNTGIYLRPLVPIRLCPWSSPFYAQASQLC